MVSLACQGLPTDVACSFSPASLPVKNPTIATMNVSSSTATANAQNTDGSAGLSSIAYGALLPWNLISVLATMATRRRRKWGLLRMLLLLVLIIPGAMTMTGCGVSYNTVAQTYHVTLSASANGSTVQTASFDVVLKEKPTPW